MRELFGHDWRSKYLAALCAAAHLCSAYWATQCTSTITYIVMVYGLGATLAQAGFLAIHELSHNLFFKSGLHNRAFAIFMNLPLVVPFAIVFRHYHLMHHAHQGTKLDLDLPSDIETHIFRGVFGKSLWLAFQLVFYAVRPCIQHPLRPSFLIMVNAFVQILFNVAIIVIFGWPMLRFLVYSIYLAGGLHPCAGHFLSEHFLFARTEKAQDTFSYYGALNLLTWNVGYHVEHHDFPNIPGSRLPKCNAIASRHYRSLQTCASWSYALVQFVLRPDMTMLNRHHVNAAQAHSPRDLFSEAKSQSS